MYCYLSWMTNHLFVGINVRCPEIYKNVYNKHDVYHEVHHVERAAGITTLSSLLLLYIIEQEGRAVRRENSRVDD